MTTTTAEEYLTLPYRIVLTFDRDDHGREGWVAQVEELPGCVSQGATPDEAIVNVRDAMAGWISVALEAGDEIPKPGDGDYSGRFLLRIPRSLHGVLVRQAEREGVSLNQYATAILAGGAPWRVRQTKATRRASPSRRTSERAGD